MEVLLGVISGLGNSTSRFLRAEGSTRRRGFSGPIVFAYEVLLGMFCLDPIEPVLEYKEEALPWS